MSRLHFSRLLIVIACLVMTACDVPEGPETGPDAAPKATQAPPTAAPPTAEQPTAEPPTAQPPTAVVEAATAAPIEPTAVPDPADLLGLVPPLNAAQLCGLLTPGEIQAIQGWAWEPAEVSTADTCAYATVDLHTGAYIRLTNSRFTREEFLGFYPTAAQFEGEGLLMADSDNNGHLDDFWIALTPEAGLHLSIFATRLTEQQALEMVEALFS